MHTRTIRIIFSRSDAVIGSLADSHPMSYMYMNSICRLILRKHVYACILNDSVVVVLVVTDTYTILALYRLLE